MIKSAMAYEINLPILLTLDVCHTFNIVMSPNTENIIVFNSPIDYIPLLTKGYVIESPYIDYSFLFIPALEHPPRV